MAANWKHQPWLCLDVETTGLNPSVDKIVQLGGVWYQQGHVLKRMHALVDPQRPISPQASRVNGITNDMVVGCPVIEQLAQEFLSGASQASVVVGYNWSFDDDFLYEAFGHRWAEATQAMYIVDVLEMARHQLPHLPRHRLVDVAAALNVPGAHDAHNAVSDAEMTCHVLHYLSPYVPDGVSVGAYGYELAADRSDRLIERTEQLARKAEKQAQVTKPSPAPPSAEEIVAAHAQEVEAAMSHHRTTSPPFDWSTATHQNPELALLATQLDANDPTAHPVMLQRMLPERTPSLPVERITAADGHVVIDLRVEDVEKAVPTKTPRALASGRVSWRDTPKKAVLVLYQDHVCSWALRAAAEAFALVPTLASVVVNARAFRLNSATGHEDDDCLVSVHVARTILDGYNLARVDPSDCIESLDARMSFGTRVGFRPVEPLGPDERRLHG